ncbi:MAG: TIGR00341 family protein, partial [Candidatus Aenigmatarchaeota archaeon]
IHHADMGKNVEDLLEEIPNVDLRVEKNDGKVTTEVVLPADKVDKAVEILENEYSGTEDYSILILPVEASLPREEVEEVSEEKREEKDRVGIEEIYQKVYESSKVSKTYLVMVILASIVASIGVLYNDIPVIVGSMVIAPLLHPSMALSLATTLADIDLFKRAIKGEILGFTVPILIGIIFGAYFTVDPTASQIVSRTNITLLYILLALSSGIAGSLSVTKGVSQTIVGVMIAVALLPPLVTTGLLIGDGYLMLSMGSFILFSVNMVSINLSGVTTFIVQEINPTGWWEKEKAKDMVKKAMSTWILLLLILAVLIVVYRNFFLL